MSWLDCYDVEFKYLCPTCGERTYCTLKNNDPTCKASRPCVCGSEAEYDGFLPIKINLRGKVAFEKNGIKAYEITDGKGGVRYISAEKDHYQNTGDINPCYTKEYEAKLKREGKTEFLQNHKLNDLVTEKKGALDRAKKMEAAKAAATAAPQ